MENCCFNCFKGGCLHYCDGLIEFNAVAPANGTWRLDLYWGNNFIKTVTVDLLAGEPITFEAGILNSEMDYNAVLIDPAGVIQSIDADSNCAQFSSINAPSFSTVQIPLLVIP